MKSSRIRSFRLWALLLALLIPAVLLSTLALGQGGRRHQGESGERGERGRTMQRGTTAAQRYKNIQVLKTLPADQLLPTMRTFAASLGVRCDFCHATRADRPDFASDAKPEKRMARRMILMVRSINQRERVLDNRATCYMCHHGHEVPETRPPVGEGRPGAPGGERERERD